MKDPLGFSPSKGNQGATRGKLKTYFDLGGNRTRDLRFRSTVTLPIELRGRTEKVRHDLGGRSRRRESKPVHMNIVPRSSKCYVHSTLIYTSEFILCSTICVHSGTRHNIHFRH